MDWQRINLQDRNIQAEIHNVQEQNIHEEQMQNLMEQNMHEEPVQNMQEIQEHLNEAAQAVEWENNHAQLPPQAVPQPPMVQEVAAITKQEKKMLKLQQREEMRRRQEEERQRQEEERQRQEEARRRQQEEEARALREAREARMRREEEERQEKRKLLFEDDITLHAMKEMAQEVDETLLREKMQRFLKTAAKRLLELRPELKADYQRTVDYVPVAESLKLIALEHAVNEEQLKLAENAKRQMEAFGELNQENVLMRVVQFELADIFKEEYAALSGLERASSAIMEQYQERDQRQMSELEDLGQQVAEAFHIKSEDGQRVNILEKDSPFAYLGKKEELEKYHAQVQEVMERSHCTKKEAERRVIEDRRTILQQEALRKTRQGSVVKNITAEDWQRYGGASFHHILPAGEALQTVEASHGYLYAKDVGGGLMELHHTLPETIELNIGNEKKTYPLRRNYNLLIKCIATQMVDKNGKMHKDTARVKQMYNLQDVLSNAAGGFLVENKFKSAILESMKEVFENEEAAKEETDRLYIFLKDMMAANGEERFILKPEILMNLERFITCFETAGKESLTEQKNQLEDAMKVNGCSPEVIRTYVDALTSFHADMDSAAMDMLDIRNMNINSKDVPLSNACSANAYFYNNLNKISQNDMNTISYQIIDYVKEFPGANIDYIYANKHKWNEYKMYETQLERIKERFDKEENLTGDEIGVIYEVAKDWYKYNYHQAAQLGKTDNGMVITCETFAAETTQVIVAPFTRKAAVGRYRGEVRKVGSNYAVDGMTGYYNRDNPLPAEEDIRPKLKENFVYKGIAGVVDYAKENK